MKAAEVRRLDALIKDAAYRFIEYIPVDDLQSFYGPVHQLARNPLNDPGLSHETRIGDDNEQPCNLAPTGLTSNDGIGDWEDETSSTTSQHSGKSSPPISELGDDDVSISDFELDQEVSSEEETRSAMNDEEKIIFNLFDLKM